MTSHVKRLWTIDWHDGPIRGIAECDKDKVYFDVKEYGGWESFEPSSEERETLDKNLDFDIADGKRIYHREIERTYNLFELPDDLLRTLIKNNKKFVKMVLSPDANEETRAEIYKNHKNNKPLDTSNLKLLKTINYSELDY